MHRHAGHFADLLFRERIEGGAGDGGVIALNNGEPSRGEVLLERIAAQARQMGLSKLFVLTTRSIHWFQDPRRAPVIRMHRHAGHFADLLFRERIEGGAGDGGLSKLFVLTTRSIHWFQERGFTPVDIDLLPESKN
jgi:N-acetylglutamate synthase-like GNAT family acetyltransferase